MNKFKQDMNKFIGESPRFKESLKYKILLEAKNGNRLKKAAARGFSTFKFAAIFALLLIVAASFLAVTLTKDGQKLSNAWTGHSGNPVTNFADESENWKVTYTQKNLGDGSREALMTVEFIGEGSKPEEIEYQFNYKQNQESFGGSLLLNPDGSYADVDFEACTLCKIYAEDDKVPGTIEWEGHQESLVLTKTKESKWKESPLFESGIYTMIGEEGKAGFIYDDEVSRFYVDNPQKYMWHFWGSQVELTGRFKVMGTHENSSEEIIVVPESDMSIPSPNNGADHSIPTSMALPEKGMWKLKAVINNKVIGTVYVEVHEKK